MKFSSLAPGLLLATTCVALAVFHARRARRLTLLTWSLLAIGGIYGAGSALTASGAALGYYPEWDRYLTVGGADLGYHAMLALVLATGMSIGWSLIGSILPKEARRVPQPRSDAAPFVICASLLLAAAVIFQLLYSYAYGGPIGLLEHARGIRGGWVNVQNPLSFLQPFGGLAIFSSFVFGGLALSRRSDARLMAAFILSALISLYVLYSWLGRISLLIYVMTFIVAGAFRLLQGPVRQIFFLLASFSAILVAAYGMSYALRLNPTDDLLSFVAKELCYPFASYFAHMMNEPMPYRWLYDFAAAPFFLLPEKWVGGWLEFIDVANTAMIHGGQVVGWKVIVQGSQLYRSVPIDLLTLGLVQVPIVGVPLTGVIFGSLLRLVDMAVARIGHPGVRAIIEVHLGFRLAILGVSGAAPGLLVRNCFYLLVGGVLLTILLRYDWRQIVGFIGWSRFGSRTRP